MFYLENTLKGILIKREKKIISTHKHHALESG